MCNTSTNAFRHIRTGAAGHFYAALSEGESSTVGQAPGASVRVRSCALENAKKPLRICSDMRARFNVRFFVPAPLRAHTCVRAFSVVRPYARASVCVYVWACIIACMFFCEEYGY